MSQENDVKLTDEFVVHTGSHALNRIEISSCLFVYEKLNGHRYADGAFDMEKLMGVGIKYFHGVI